MICTQQSISNSNHAEPKRRIQQAIQQMLKLEQMKHFEDETQLIEILAYQTRYVQWTQTDHWVIYVDLLTQRQQHVEYV